MYKFVRFGWKRPLAGGSLLVALGAAQLLLGETKAGPKAPGPYLLGRGDQFTVYQANVEEIDGKRFSIDDTGDATLPLLGRVPLGGLNVEQAEKVLSTKLSRFLVDPRPSVVISEYRSQPVSVLGAVTNPGVYHLEGERTLLEVLSSAGGLRADAGATLQLSRKIACGRIPLKAEHLDSSGELSVADINVASLLAGSDGSKDVVIRPQDIIFVAKGEMIFVAGDVKKPGGFPLGQDASGLSSLQALTLAEGLNPTADGKHARIIRLNSDRSIRQEVPIDLNKAYSGPQSDVRLQARDILFVPSSNGKKAGRRVTEAMIQAVTGIAIFGRF